jgi:multiple sugar transport system permease protein
VKAFVEERSALIMALPTILVLLIFSLFPFFYILGLSLTDSTLARPFQDFLWLSNYQRALNDDIFQASITNTIWFAFAVTIIESLLGFVLALFFYRSMRAGRYLRTLALLPFIAPPVAIAMIWRLIYDPVAGLLNHYLTRLHLIERPIAFLGDPRLAMASIMAVDVWQWTPFIFILALAALQSLPTEPYEAAAVDGASGRQMFRYLTLPLVAPALLVIALIRLIGAFKIFDLVYILTFGGPGSLTQVASFYIYKTGFSQFKSGYAAALTVVLLIVMAIIVTLLTSARDRLRAQYE